MQDVPRRVSLSVVFVVREISIVVIVLLVAASVFVVIEVVLPAARTIAVVAGVAAHVVLFLPDKIVITKER